MAADGTPLPGFAPNAGQPSLMPAQQQQHAGYNAGYTQPAGFGYVSGGGHGNVGYQFGTGYHGGAGGGYNAGGGGGYNAGGYNAGGYNVGAGGSAFALNAGVGYNGYNAGSYNTGGQGGGGFPAGGGRGRGRGGRGPNYRAMEILGTATPWQAETIIEMAEERIKLKAAEAEKVSVGPLGEIKELLIRLTNPAAAAKGDVMSNGTAGVVGITAAQNVGAVGTGVNSLGVNVGNAGVAGVHATGMNVTGTHVTGAHSAQLMNVGVASGSAQGVDEAERRKVEMKQLLVELGVIKPAMDEPKASMLAMLKELGVVQQEERPQGRTAMRAPSRVVGVGRPGSRYAALARPTSNDDSDEDEGSELSKLRAALQRKEQEAAQLAKERDVAMQQATQAKHAKMQLAKETSDSMLLVEAQARAQSEREREREKAARERERYRAELLEAQLKEVLAEMKRSENERNKKDGELAELRMRMSEMSKVVRGKAGVKQVPVNTYPTYPDPTYPHIEDCDFEDDGTVDLAHEETGEAAPGASSPLEELPTGMEKRRGRSRTPKPVGVGTNKGVKKLATKVDSILAHTAEVLKPLRATTSEAKRVVPGDSLLSHLADAQLDTILESRPTTQTAIMEVLRPHHTKDTLLLICHQFGIEPTKQDKTTMLKTIAHKLAAELSEVIVKLNELGLE